MGRSVDTAGDLTPKLTRGHWPPGLVTHRGLVAAPADYLLALYETGTRCGDMDFSIGTWISRMPLV
jgi:hypothetical protein